MQVNPIDLKKFRRVITSHYRLHGRDMAWRRTRNPYHILVSEVMLQQTQVSRVEKFYPEFLKKFPTARALARAPLADVMRAWQGLGYNRRALMLKKLAKQVVANYSGKIPADPALLEDLPGIGAATAAAVAAFAFNMPSAFIETNIRRVFIHFFFPQAKKVSDKDIMPFIGATLDRKNPREWYYALMDYGSHLGREEKENPNRRSVHYVRQSGFEGSDRQVRARIVRLLLVKKEQTLAEIARNLGERENRIAAILASLQKEGLIKKSKNHFSLHS